MSGVISDGLPVGAILASIRERSVSIISLFVLPEFRGKGTVMTMREISQKLPSEAKKKFAKTLDKRGINPKVFVSGLYDEELSFGAIMGTHISGIILSRMTEIKNEVVIESLITIVDKIDALALMTRFATDVLPLLGKNGAISFVTGDSNTDKLMRQLLGDDILTTRNAIHAGILL